VIIVVKGLHPTVACLNGESTRHTLGGEQFVPILFAVWKVVLKVEWGVGEYFTAVSANETLWMESFTHCLQAVLQIC